MNLCSCVGTLWRQLSVPKLVSSAEAPHFSQKIEDMILATVLVHREYFENTSFLFVKPNVWLNDFKRM